MAGVIGGGGAGEPLEVEVPGHPLCCCVHCLFAGARSLSFSVCVVLSSLLVKLSELRIRCCCLLWRKAA